MLYAYTKCYTCSKILEQTQGMVSLADLMPNGDFERIFAALANEKVRYLVVGGVAAIEFADAATRERWVTEKGLTVFSLVRTRRTSELEAIARLEAEDAE
ncbi:MAG: hypothetical protein ACOZIN_01655 [Myxococcota bacterium]